MISIASVCRTLPTPDEPTAGLFVLRRLVSMGRLTRLHTLQPIPWYPLVRALPHWGRTQSHKAMGVYVEHLPMFYVPGIMKGLDGYWLYRSVLKKLTQLKSAGELDLIDAHFAYPDGAGCVRAAQELGVPAFITMRGVEEDYLNLPHIARQIKSALRSADGCICVSHSLRETALACGVPPEKVRVIHNAVDRDTFKPSDRAAARSKLGVRADSRLVVSVGNLLSVKRHDILIRAVAMLKAADVRLVIIGGAMHEPKHPLELQRLCKDLGIAQRVKFAGRLSPDQVAQWLNAANVFALASRREGCCNAVLEALACGLPVVATAVGDNPWFVKSGLNGRIVPVDDSPAMADALNVALDRKDWDKDHIAATLQVGDWDSVAAETLDFFESRVRSAASENAS